MGAGTSSEVSAVNFGTTAGTGLSVTSDTNLSITSPAGSGTVDITVTTAGGTSTTSSADQFTYAPVPTVTKINTTSGPVAGGTVVTVTGSGFYGGGPSSEVSAVNFGTTAGTSLSVTSDTNLSITSPAGSGTVDITVTTAGGTSLTGTADQFTYVTGPTVTGISPNSGTTAGGTSVTITGTNLSNATAVKFGSNTAAITSDTTTQIIATSPADTATVDITVTTAGGNQCH